jgi:hypothetical protein
VRCTHQTKRTRTTLIDTLARAHPRAHTRTYTRTHEHDSACLHRNAPFDFGMALVVTAALVAVGGYYLFGGANPRSTERPGDSDGAPGPETDSDTGRSEAQTRSPARPARAVARPTGSAAQPTACAPVKLGLGIADPAAQRFSESRGAGAAPGVLGRGGIESKFVECTTAPGRVFFADVGFSCGQRHEFPLVEN